MGALVTSYITWQSTLKSFELSVKKDLKSDLVNQFNYLSYIENELDQNIEILVKNDFSFDFKTSDYDQYSTNINAINSFQSKDKTLQALADWAKNWFAIERRHNVYKHVDVIKFPHVIFKASVTHNHQQHDVDIGLMKRVFTLYELFNDYNTKINVLDHNSNTCITTSDNLTVLPLFTCNLISKDMAMASDNLEQIRQHIDIKESLLKEKANVQKKINDLGI